MCVLRNSSLGSQTICEKCDDDCDCAVCDVQSTIHSVQFSDTTQNLDITSSPSRELDADEVCVWTADSELIVSVNKTRDNLWNICGSHYFDWFLQSRLTHRTWRDATEVALNFMGIPLDELDAVL